jgi:hypothetical protein
MLGQAGSGKLRVSMGQNKLAAKAAKKYEVLSELDESRLAIVYESP